MDIKEKVKKLPETPGIYIMKDAQDDIMYVGKAKRLKNRVSQYFRKSENRQPKIERMIEGISGFDIIHTDTELEALLLECRLIKDLKPIYNSQLKNHQKYTYLWLNTEEKYPRLEIVREKQDIGKNFGPYGSLKHVERAVAVIRESAQIRHCTSLTNRKSGCLNNQFGYCLGPCTGEVSELEYKYCVDKVLDFLEGRNDDLIKGLERKMKASADAFEFIKAAKNRDDMQAVQHLMYRGKTVRFAQGGRCIAALERIEGSNYKLFIIKGSSILYKTQLEMKEENLELAQMLVSIILSNSKELLRFDGDGIEKGDIDQAQIVFSYLKNKKECSYIVIPKSWLQKRAQAKLEQGVKKLLYGLTVQA